MTVEGDLVSQTSSGPLDEALTTRAVVAQWDAYESGEFVVIFPGDLDNNRRRIRQSAYPKPVWVDGVQQQLMLQQVSIGYWVVAYEVR